MINLLAGLAHALLRQPIGTLAPFETPIGHWTW